MSPRGEPKASAVPQENPAEKTKGRRAKRVDPESGRRDLKTNGESAIACNSGQSAIVVDAPTPIDTTPRPVIAGPLGESLGNREDARIVVEPSSRPSVEALDVERLAAMLGAIDGLLRSGLVVHARSVLGEARALVEGASGPTAVIVDLAHERSKRSD